MTILFMTGDGPATLGTTPVIELALSRQSTPPAVLAYLDTFAAGAGSSFTGELDGSDTRLAGYIRADKGTATLDLEVAWTVSSVRYIAPNLAATVQQAIIYGAQSTNGGPAYATTAQIAAAVAGLAGSGAVAMLPQSVAVTIAPLSAYLIYHAPCSAGFGTGAYTQGIVLSVANAQPGSLMLVPIDVPGAPNPTINIYDGTTGGTLLQTLSTAGAPSGSFLFTARFDGTNWHKLDAHWVL